MLKGTVISELAALLEPQHAIQPFSFSEFQLFSKA
jgi:hypothetical protein